MTIVWVLLVVIVLMVLFLIAIYNGLVQKRVRCQEAWSQIDVQLKRRYDLIPNLVETVKGYAAHEKQTLERVIQARSAAIAASGVKDQAQAENMLTGALRQLLALSEAYPNLKANENFAQLQEELASTENRIAFSRQHYNDSTGLYNTARQRFPSNVVAGMFAFVARDFFELEEPAERQAPKVQF
ncbi:MAG TPA: LemA family protein [Phycisphaerae bacterium]|nr:LemA family protein [Phycisphaerae bacterium]